MTKPREYTDLRLELRDLDLATDTFTVAVAGSSVVGESEPVTVPLRRDEMEDGLDRLDRKRSTQEELITLGKQLADRLVPGGDQGSPRDLFVAALRAAGQDGGVRLRLVIRDPALAQLPWEFTYLQRHQGEADRRHFLVLDPQVSMVRHQALPEAQPPLAARSPDRLRFVAALANPDALGFRKLNLGRERKVIEGALANITADSAPIEVVAIVDDASPGDLANALQGGADLFHFAGHGTFQEGDTAEGGKSLSAGSILLHKEKGSKEPLMLSAVDLALQVQAAGVRVGVLGACESGRRDGVTAWTDVATALVERGIPVVVAMQYEVLDASAITFSEALYSALANGLTIDEAVALGRLAMVRGADTDDVEWGVPVVYMRSPNGQIFPALVAKPSATTDQMRLAIDQTVRLIEKGGKVIGLDVPNLGESLTALGTALREIEVNQEVDTVKGTLIGVTVGRSDRRGTSNQDPDKAHDP